MEAVLKARLEADASRMKRELATVEKQLGQFGNKVRGGTNVLTDFSRVISDAPYGIRGVGNNIEQLVSNFGNLSRSAGGATGAFKAVFSSLAGPAGILVGVSLVTSALTALEQKYGSLGNAISNLLGDTTALTKKQLEYAESIAEEASEISLLVNIYPALEGQRDKQNVILDKLNKVAPTYFGNLKGEKDVVEQLTKSYDRYLKSLLGKIFIESQQEKLVEVAKEYAKQLTILNQKQVEGAKRRDREANKLKEFVALTERLGNAQKNVRGDISLGVTLDTQAAPVTFQDALQKLIDQFKTDAKQIFAGTDGILAELDIEGIFGDPKKQKQVTQKIADFSKFLARDFVTELDLSVDEEFRKNNPFTPPKQFGPFNPIDLIIADINVREANERAKRIAAFQEQQRISLLARNKATFEALKAQQQEFQNTLTIGLAQPLGDLIFNFLDKGKFAFKDFADAAITAIKRIVAQLVATKIIQLLASLTPFGAGLKAAKGIGAFLQGGFSFVTRGASAPNFGGIQGGLSGEVVFVQRGADLVGVLNRTNNRIGRVG